MTEIWKEIEGYDGLYEVSDKGNVRSRNYNHTGTTQVLQPGEVRGYLQVGLNKNGKRKRFFVHRLVAKAFLENTQNLLEVNHKNEDKADNRIENLEWCSREYNNNFGTRNRRIAESNTNNPKRSKAVLQISKSGEFLKEFPSLMEAWRETGIYHGHICRCCLGKLKSAGGYLWRYK